MSILLCAACFVGGAVAGVRFWPVLKVKLAAILAKAKALFAKLKW